MMLRRDFLTGLAFSALASGALANDDDDWPGPRRPILKGHCSLQTPGSPPISLAIILRNGE